jgi:adenylate cyclase
MRQILFKLFSVQLILLMTLNCYSQNKKRLDSLNVQLNICRDDSVKVNLYYAIASIEQDYKKFIDNIDKAYDLSLSLNQKDALKRSYDSLYSRFITCRIDTQKVLFYFRLSEATKDTVLIRQTITKGLTLAERINYVHGIAMGLNTLGQYYRQQGIKDYPKSIALYDSALVIATKVLNKADMASAYHNLGQIFRFKGDYARALDYYNKANVVAHEASDSTQIMWNYHDIGWMRISMKNYPEAIAHLEQGLALANAIQHTYATADITMHIGEAYWFMGKFDSSLFLSNKAYELFKPQRSDENMIHCLNQLGWVYESRFQWKEAEDVYRRAIMMSEDSASKWSACAFAGLGDALYGQGRYNEALLNYKRAAEFLSFETIDRLTKDCYEGLAKAYVKVGDFKNAYEAQLKFKTASDSVLILENSEKLLATQAQYDFEKQRSDERVARENELARQRNIRNTITAGLGVAILFLFVVYRQRNKIKAGKKRSDELLLNILPEEVAEELNAKGSADAKQFDDVTVMFTDFKNFTQISERLSPAELVAEIHTCFKAFDTIIGKHNIEKIKTIGDSYMCAGGLPVANKTNAIDVVNAAMEIQQFMQQHLLQRKNEGKEVFEIRIGVHTGPVVAGIVGIKKFAYDIWGDTVNIASRMESSGEAGKVNISGTTFELVKNGPAGQTGKFNFMHRGNIPAKNKGEIEMYFVEAVS